MILQLDTTTDADELISALMSNSKNELIQFIVELDIRVAEVDFTIELVKSLLKSLETDLTKKEIKELLK